jgi:hypothetical protein
MSWTIKSVVGGLVLVVAVAAIVMWVRKRSSGNTTWVASDGTPVPANVAEALTQVAKLKSAALKNATVQVHRAYLYRGPTEVQVNEKGKLIAVDITVAGSGDYFKIWDLDIIDGATNENFGSDPDVAFLDTQGKCIAFEAKGLDLKKPFRLLLVYGVPLNTKTIKLGYWGQDLTPAPTSLQPSGPPLPKRQ